MRLRMYDVTIEVHPLDDGGAGMDWFAEVFGEKGRGRLEFRMACPHESIASAARAALERAPEAIADFCGEESPMPDGFSLGTVIVRMVRRGVVFAAASHSENKKPSSVFEEIERTMEENESRRISP